MQQLGLDEIGAPGRADAKQVLPAGCEVDPHATAAPVANVMVNRDDVRVGGADVAEHANEDVLVPHSQNWTDGSPRVISVAVDEPHVSKHEVHHDAHDLSVLRLLCPDLEVGGSASSGNGI
jgi:hypothetical protein